MHAQICTLAGDGSCDRRREGKVTLMKRRKNVENHRDPIRIVPLHGGEVNGAATPAARLTYRKGPLIRSVEVFTIFWGPGCKKTDLSEIDGSMAVFFDAIL